MRLTLAERTQHVMHDGFSLPANYSFWETGLTTSVTQNLPHVTVKEDENEIQFCLIPCVKGISIPSSNQRGPHELRGQLPK